MNWIGLCGNQTTKSAIHCSGWQILLNLYLLRGHSHFLCFYSNGAIIQHQVCNLTRYNNTIQQRISQCIIDVGLNRSTQRTSAKLFIEPLTQQQIPYLIANHQLDLLFTQARANLIQQQINNFVEFWSTQSME